MNDRYYGSSRDDGVRRPRNESYPQPRNTNYPRPRNETGIERYEEVYNRTSKKNTSSQKKTQAKSSTEIVQARSPSSLQERREDERQRSARPA